MSAVGVLIGAVGMPMHAVGVLICAVGVTNGAVGVPKGVSAWWDNTLCMQLLRPVLWIRNTLFGRSRSDRRNDSGSHYRQNSFLPSAFKIFFNIIFAQGMCVAHW